MEEPSKSFLVRAVVAAAGIAGLAVALPFVYFAFLSTLGLLGIGIAGIIGIGMIRALPYLGQRWENKLLGLRKNEARRNPIEQMQNRLLEKGAQLEAFKRALSTIGGQIQGLTRMVDERHRTDPTHDLSEMRRAIEKMQDFYATMQQKYKNACTAFNSYKVAVDRKMFEYGFAQAGQAALKSMNATDAENMMKDMLADEAFKSVAQQFDATFAALDIESAAMTNAKQLEFGKGVTIDLTAIQIPSKAA